MSERSSESVLLFSIQLLALRKISTGSPTFRERDTSSLKLIKGVQHVQLKGKIYVLHLDTPYA
jgi:hypothetical protein